MIRRSRTRGDHVQGIAKDIRQNDSLHMRGSAPLGKSSALHRGKTLADGVDLHDIRTACKQLLCYALQLIAGYQRLFKQGASAAGQKKKVLLARSMCQSAHLYIWDEPLNYVDVLSRIQIEELLQAFRPTLLFVEHDRVFCEKIATKTVEL